MYGVITLTSPKKGHRSLQISKMYLRLVFRPLRTNLPYVPKRLTEASFISPKEEDHESDQETIFTNGFVTSEYG